MVAEDGRWHDAWREMRGGRSAVREARQPVASDATGRNCRSTLASDSSSEKTLTSTAGVFCRQSRRMPFQAMRRIASSVCRTLCSEGAADLGYFDERAEFDRNDAWAKFVRCF